jgi:hypothetical protein
MTNRRQFLRALGGLAATAALTPERVLADPYGILTPRDAVRAGVAHELRPTLRVRGVVRSAGRGLARVGLTDGFNVVETDAEGRFELLTSPHRGFVSMSLPSGHAIPRDGQGIARHFRPLVTGASEQDVVFNLEPSAIDDARHTALILPDIQTENAFEMARFHAESVPDVAATVRADTERMSFGLSAGDILFDDLTMYPDYIEGVARTGIPFFQVVGNHDLDFDGASDEETTRTFSGYFGPRYYSFDRGAVHYVVLDDVMWHGSDYIGYLGHDQLHWLAQDLARVEAGRPVIVVTHIPVLGSRYARDGEQSPAESVSITNREALYRLLEPFDAHVVAGHTHENDHVFSHGVHEHISGTVCGAWWSGDICGDGTPNGYSVYEIEGEEVRWRYKSTGQPDDHQMRVYARGADAGAPDEIVANVWDADPQWTVVWYENGERRGLMARRQGLDPRSVAEHSGEELPERRPWVDPYPTRHMYYAPVPATHGEIMVEATDRFGRVYREVLPAAE